MQWTLKNADTVNNSLFSMLLYTTISQLYNVLTQWNSTAHNHLFCILINQMSHHGEHYKWPHHLSCILINQSSHHGGHYKCTWSPLTYCLKNHVIKGALQMAISMCKRNELSFVSLACWSHTLLVPANQSSTKTMWQSCSQMNWQWYCTNAKYY